MVGWHHRLNGHVFEQALGDGEGQGRLAYCSPWGRKELDMTEPLKSNSMCTVICENDYFFLFNPYTCYIISCLLH